VELFKAILKLLKNSSNTFSFSSGAPSSALNTDGHLKQNCIPLFAGQSKRCPFGPLKKKLNPKVR